MEVQDGFSLSIFNYCDGWCEACAFAARCRVSAGRVTRELEDPEPTARPEHVSMETRARQYSLRTLAWLTPKRDPAKTRSDPHNPLDVIGWFSFFIAAKIHRAEAYDGSARIALEAIDRSRAAWLAMAETGVATREEVTPFIVDLLWLGEALDREFPNVRKFIRPGLDEPEEAAKLASMPD